MKSTLVEKIRAIERKHVGHDDSQRKTPAILSSGWAEVDTALGGGLPCGLHEWFGLAPASANVSPDRKFWRPPLCALIHLVRRGLETAEPGRRVIWIGRKCFPYPSTLHRNAGDRFLLQRSLFVAPRNSADRLWAIDLALRSPAVGVVIADGSGFDMAATRRIQLVASNHAAQAFLVRPPWEQCELSAAQSRWMVRNVAANADSTGSTNPVWTIELLRCKGVHWGITENIWRVEWDRAECALHLSTKVADSVGAAPSATSKRSSRRLA
ncbi:MAG: hypothetical protein HY287_00045 [Planctomycetes bacterium]|nr:hypothetical protein [Planctomycetota bacterium]MBI3832705.1 hypothetical protein [Planctomycetota bacterium]